MSPSRPRRLRFAHLVRVLATLAPLAFTVSASAAPPFIDRPITLPRHDWAFDVGVGLGFENVTRSPSRTGAGLNLEMGVGLTDHVELGVRTGVRGGDDGAATGADQFGRLFDRETFGTGSATFANPEVRVRGALLRGGVAEVALEGRVVLPAERGTRTGVEVGAPLAFHAGRIVRIDTGVFIPVEFYDPAAVGVHFPISIWFQPAARLWLGPIAGFRFIHHHENLVAPGVNPDFDRTDFELGFGLGYSITRTIDFKTMVLNRSLNHGNGVRDIGVGAGLQFRIE